ncbi:SH3 domain-containing protein [Alkalinema pantanalense CENA528]|uniref:SH3 domain-containing protein n=1 Tax=Alkalinema pantanalense TaxID=1620705 RepID=UPI003D6F35DC
MASKSTLVAAGLTGIAAVTVGTLALVQPKPEPSSTPNPTSLQSAPANRDGSISPNLSPSPSASASTGTLAPDSTANPTVLPSSVPPRSTEATIRQLEKCKVTMAKVDDPNPPSNLRSQPNTDASSTIVGQLKNGTFLTVVEEKNNWFRISTPAKGWISKSVVQSGCNEKTERVSFAKGSTRAEISDEFIGSGSHIYRFQLAQGQTLTITSQKGPLPAVSDPNGKFITGMEDQQTAWSQKLTIGGDYQIILDSNFKGYKYRFQVEAQ